MTVSKTYIVKSLQLVLNKLCAAGLAPDGIYGEFTEKAVKAALGETSELQNQNPTPPESPNFSLSEYYSNEIVSGKKRTKTLKPPKELWENIQISMDKLEVLRDKAGDRQISILSGYRSPQYNAWLYENSKDGGVAKNSPHMRGTATDIQIKGITPKEVYQIADKLFPDAGIGLYDTFVHIDWDILLLNGNKRPARW